MNFKAFFRGPGGKTRLFVLILFVLILIVMLVLTLFRRSNEALDTMSNSIDDVPETNYIYYAGAQLPIADNAEENTFSADAFSYDENGYIRYNSPDAQYGIDVSSHQGVIDWAAVKEAGIDFAIIRAGYRGITQGTLFTDEYFEANIEGALEAGIEVGAYIFSQAASEEEAIEEAEYILDLIGGREIQYPVVFDWESVNSEGSRTTYIDRENLSKYACAFCDTIKNAGYTPAIYFNRQVGYLGYDFDEICEYALWLAEYADYPSFYYSFDMWQYSSSGSVPGIEGNVDLDICFTARQ